MPVCLLDVNTLLALAWPTHIHHLAAHRWFHHNHQGGWATCLMTQLGFARLSMQPAVVKVPLLFGDAIEALERIQASEAHRFWPQEYGLSGVREEIRSRVVGHQQITDALLLDLAIRNDGRLATFDRRIAALLPPNSGLQQAVELIPA